MTAATAGQKKYAEYRKSFRWWLVRTVRRSIDGGRCRCCHHPANLVCHHAEYRYRGRGGIWGTFAEINDTITLCGWCHDAIHAGRSHSKIMRSGALKKTP